MCIKKTLSSFKRLYKIGKAGNIPVVAGRLFIMINNNSVISKCEIHQSWRMFQRIFNTIDRISKGTVENYFLVSLHHGTRMYKRASSCQNIKTELSIEGALGL